ncbi:parathyroid hormone-related protein isoform X2 [Hyla sarda]|nr:parathyroid hormone-related protein isoform X2 [Hyla sarda]XP_056373788.1 parathyroid hormone-related protein isoform X2 [Hyla sarda]XP_056373789.1 parathyroid hormone-related protein isoform X2 [Hyla sarda]XP_056373790.1 parathyroid hormone-related protein isoform X2 [Hyla sarda]XP_056373791.1 parathyroid hormone-related protein isoform X2 [Hyla sarda]
MLRSLLPHCSLVVFILSCSFPAHGRPTHGLNGRVRRAVSEHQLLHDKGRSLQELRRRIFLQSLMEGVNTAEIRAAPDELPRPIPSVKNFNTLRLVGEEEAITSHLTQETHKSLSFKDPPPKIPGKKKKGKPGKRKEQEKRKRRERSALESLQDPPGSDLWWEELGISTQ